MKFFQALGLDKNSSNQTVRQNRRRRAELERRMGLSRYADNAGFEQLESRLLLSGTYFDTLAGFPTGAGSNPVSGLIMDAKGNLYGTTYNGGAAGDGTIFKIAAGTKTITTLASFNGANGANPWGRLAIDSHGNLYGTTTAGGDLGADQNGKGFGTIFKLAAGSKTIKTIAKFNGYNGLDADGGLIIDKSGNIFGTTYGGGDTNSYGTIFKVSAGSSTIKTLAKFTGGVNGMNPMGDLYMDAHGNLYGTTVYGGKVSEDTNGKGFGTIFKFNQGSSTITVLASLSSSVGANPIGGVVADASGNLYGSASAGGANNKGSIFELPAGSGTIVNIASFNGTNGAAPYNTMVMDTSGNLFGTTLAGGSADAGAVFKLAAGSNTITTLTSLDGSGNGARPYGGLLTDGHGNFYGTAAFSGVNYSGGYGSGLVYEVGYVGAPAKLSFGQQPPRTSVGEAVLPAIKVNIQDAMGHLVDTDSSQVTLQIVSPNGATLNGTLTATAVNGVATFSNISFPVAGTYILKATANGLAAATSSAFTVTNSVFSVLGKGVRIVNGDTTPSAADNTDFGSAPTVDVNGVVTRTFTIQSLSSSPVTIGNITISGADASEFSVKVQPASSTTNKGSTSFTISFKPGSAGLKKAKISFTSNDSTQSVFTFNIQGTGVVMQGAPSGLQTLTTQAGAGPRAVTGQTLSVLYTGTLLDGTVFDASSLHDNTPFSVKLGANQVIAGWEQGLLGMQPGETRTLVIPAALAYGSSGSGMIPPNATIMFQVQLLAIKDAVIGVAGKGQNISAGDTTPSKLDGTDFGSIPQGSSRSQTFNISDFSGNGTLKLTGKTPVTITGPGADQFVITQPSLGRDQSGTFKITYKPNANKTAVATITIASSDPTTPNFSFTITGSTMIDLTGSFADNINIPVSATPGSQISIPITVKNTGGKAASGPINIVVKASTDGSWNNSDYTLATLTGVSINLGVNGSKTWTLTATIPDSTVLAFGSYKLVAMIDAGTMTESSTANNLISLKGTAPVNLHVTPVGVNLKPVIDMSKLNLSAYVPGETIKVPIIVTNMGNQSAIGSDEQPITVILRASANGVYSDASPLLAQLSISSTIAAGKSVTLYATYVVPLTIAPGSVFLTAMADAGQVVTEFDEADNATASATALNIDWRFGSIPGRSGSIPLTYTDTDGTRVTLKLSGPGTGLLTESNGHYDVTLTGTTSATTFTVTTVKSATPGDDGRTTFRNITIGETSNINDHTTIGAIKARTTDLTGDITATGAIGSLDWGKVTAAGTITIGASAGKPAESQSTSLSFDVVQDLNISSAIGISSLKATNWADTDQIASTIVAPWLGTLNIAGDKSRGLAGDLMANIQLTASHGASTSAPTLSAATVAGSVGATSWSIAGAAGSIAINGTVGTINSAWTLAGLTGAKTISLGDVTNGRVSSIGSIATLSSKRWSAGAITATAIGTLKTTGQKGTDGFAGDFSADVTLTGPGATTNAPVLATASIAGRLAAGEWSIAGAINSLTAFGTDAGWKATLTGANGKIATMTLSGAAVTNTLDLTANSIGTLTVAGGLAHSSLILNQAVSNTVKAITTFTVAGDVSDTVIRIAGNIGNVRVRSLSDTVLFAGVKPSVTALPASTADFADADATKLPSIVSLTLTGFGAAATAVFTKSYVAAGSIKTVKLPSNAANLVDATSAATQFGFATRVGTGSYNGPASAGLYVSPTNAVIS